MCLYPLNNNTSSTQFPKKIMWALLKIYYIGIKDYKAFFFVGGAVALDFVTKCNIMENSDM